MEDGSLFFIKPKNVAVLLIDMQEYFLDEAGKKAIIPYQVAIIQECQDMGIPFIVLEYEDQGDTIPELQEKIEKLPNHHWIVKSNDSAFPGTNLDDLLKEQGVEKLLLMGVNACACVRDTARDAVRKGYEIITSDMLIAGCCPVCKEATQWFEENGEYLQGKLPSFRKQAKAA
ncbi:MAG: cysteine hydrolase [Candidatus Paceibacterota bacterium]|jgi:nicotinamidase-related amidase